MFKPLVATALALSMWASQASAADCKLTRYAASDLVVHPNGGLFLPGRVDDREVLLALQMSSGLAMISPAAVSELGLKTARVRADVPLRSNGVAIEREVKLVSLVIGGADFAGWTVYVQPGASRPLPMYEGKPVIGSLSARFMNAVDMELDVAARKMNLFRHARCRGEQVYWSREYTNEYLYADPSGLLYFPLELDGKRIEASLNTSGPRSRLSEAAARRFYRFERDAGAPGRGETRPGAFVGVRRMAITSRKSELPETDVHVIDDTQRDCELGQSERGSNAIGFRNCFGIAPFEIGTDLLQHFRIYIASQEGRIYFTRSAPAGADASTPQPP
jgi:hypothetical protein